MTLQYTGDELVALITYSFHRLLKQSPVYFRCANVLTTSILWKQYKERADPSTQYIDTVCEECRYFDSIPVSVVGIRSWAVNKNVYTKTRAGTWPLCVVMQSRSVRREILETFQQRRKVCCGPVSVRACVTLSRVGVSVN